MLRASSKQHFILEEVSLDEMTFSVTWKEEILENEESVPHTKLHKIVDYNFNNTFPNVLIGDLTSHVIKLNKHIKDTSIFVKKIKLKKYGRNPDIQLVIKIDYEFSASSDKLAKGSTNSVILDKKSYKGSEDVIKIVNELEDNLFRYLVLGEKFPSEEKKIEIAGNILEA